MASIKITYAVDTAWNDPGHGSSHMQKGLALYTLGEKALCHDTTCTTIERYSGMLLDSVSAVILEGSSIHGSRVG